MNKILLVICISALFANCKKDTAPPERTEFLKVGENTSFIISYNNGAPEAPNSSSYTYVVSNKKDSLYNYEYQVISNDSAIILILDYYRTYRVHHPVWGWGAEREDIEDHQMVRLNWTSDYEFKISLTEWDGTPIDSEIWPLNTSEMTFVSTTSLYNVWSTKTWKFSGTSGLEDGVFSIQVFYHD